MRSIAFKACVNILMRVETVFLKSKKETHIILSYSDFSCLVKWDVQWESEAFLRMLKICSRGDTISKAVLSCQSTLWFQELAEHNFGPTKKYVNEMLQQLQRFSNVKSIDGRRTTNGGFLKRAVKKCCYAH